MTNSIIDELYAALQALVPHVTVHHTVDAEQGHTFTAEAKQANVVATATADTHEGALQALLAKTQEALANSSSPVAVPVVSVVTPVVSAPEDVTASASIQSAQAQQAQGMVMDEPADTQAAQ